MHNTTAGKFYIHIMDRISGIVAVFAAVLLLSGVLAVCEMVFVRSFLGQNTIWQTEYTIYSISGAMLLGSPIVLRLRGHVAVTLFHEWVSDTKRRILQYLSMLAGLAFCLAFAYASWHHVVMAYLQGWGTGSLWNPPLWAAVAPITIGATLLSLQYIAEILRGVD